MNKKIQVICQNDLIFTGILEDFDKYNNLILKDTKKNNSDEDLNEVFIKAQIVISISSVDEPEPTTITNNEQTINNN